MGGIGGLVNMAKPLLGAVSGLLQGGGGHQQSGNANTAAYYDYTNQEVE